MHKDNLISKVSRIHFDPRSFVNDEGKTVKYAPLVIEWILPGGATYSQEIKVTKETLAIIEISASNTSVAVDD
ncbi:MAG: hypothetical protein WAZ21_02500 [Candidatus Saccharimonadales bacterium]